VADLKVDTDVLRAAAGDLVGLANAAHDLADSHVRAARLAPALGLDEPAQAVDAFLNSWTYGIRWIAAQSEQIGHDLRHSADTYDLVEAQLARAAARGRPGHRDRTQVRHPGCGRRAAAHGAALDRGARPAHAARPRHPRRPADPR
jgi:hypothetical protein